MKIKKIIKITLIFLILITISNTKISKAKSLTLKEQVKITEKEVYKKYKNKKMETIENKLEVEPIKINKIKKNEKNKSYYSSLDKKGRTKSVISSITIDTLNNINNRPPFKSNIVLAGQYYNAIFDGKKWIRNNSESNNRNINGWIFNKSHLLAYSLGGDNEVHNLIWGTREQNIGTNETNFSGGMSYIENMTKKYIRENKESNILYQVVPIYNKSNHIVPKYVYVQATDLNNKNKYNKAIITINRTKKGIINYEKGNIIEKNK